MKKKNLKFIYIFSYLFQRPSERFHKNCRKMGSINREIIKPATNLSPAFVALR